MASNPAQPTIPTPADLPHGSPFRLLDRLLHVDLGRGELWAAKRLTADDALWPGEDADLADRGLDRPATLPSLLLIEALSQAAACYNLLSAAAARGAGAGTAQRPVDSGGGTHLGFLVSVTDFRFPDDLRAGATPGDTLLLHVQKAESLGALTAFTTQALCLSHPAAGGPDSAAASPPTPPFSAEAPSEKAGFLAPPGARSVGHGRLLFAVTSK